MKISLDALRKNRDFWVQACAHRSLGTIFLVRPASRKQRWQQSELPLRSLLCKEDGEIICSGLPKFFDIAEPHEDGSSRIQAIQEQLSDPTVELHLPEKVDGSLLIRTVIQGEVSLRTRGHHGLGSFSEPVLSLIKSTYPKLLEPNIDIDEMGLPQGKASLLMEFVDPERPVLVSYEKKMLKGIGVMRLSEHAHPAFCGSPELTARLQTGFDLEPLSFYPVRRDLDAIKEHIVGLSDQEGIVLWLKNKSDCFSLLKVKTDAYHLRQKRRAAFVDSKRAFFQICWLYKVEAPSDLERVLRQNDLPVTLIDDVAEELREYLSVQEQSKETIQAVEQHILVHELKNTPRAHLAPIAKELALIFSPNVPMFPLLMSLLLGKDSFQSKDEYFLSRLLGKRINIGNYRKRVEERAKELRLILP